MKLTLPRLIKYLSQFDDVLILGGSSPSSKKFMVTPEASVDVVGIKSSTHQVYTVINPDGFQPHTSVTPKILGGAFAIDILTPKSVHTKQKIAWISKWRALGGIYIGAEDLEDVEVLFK